MSAGLDLAGVLREHDYWTTTGPDDDDRWMLVCYGCKAELAYLDELPDDGTTAFDQRHMEHLDAALREHIAGWLGSDDVLHVIVMADHGGPEAIRGALVELVWGAER